MRTLFLVTMLALSIAAPAKAGDCRDALEKAAAKVVIIALPPCNSADPTCADLRLAADHAARAQQEARDKGLEIALARCAQYEKLVDERVSETAAWLQVMSKCSKDIEHITAAFFSCIQR